jgi:hypothetical protein
VQPAKKLEPIPAIHLQISHDDVRMRVTMIEWRITAQEIDGFLAIPDDAERARLPAASAESDIEQQNVVRVVFQQEQIELPHSMPHGPTVGQIHPSP